MTKSGFYTHQAIHASPCSPPAMVVVFSPCLYMAGAEHLLKLSSKSFRAPCASPRRSSTTMRPARVRDRRGGCGAARGAAGGIRGCATLARGWTRARGMQPWSSSRRSTWRRVAGHWRISRQATSAGRPGPPGWQLPMPPGASPAATAACRKANPETRGPGADARVSPAVQLPDRLVRVHEQRSTRVPIAGTRPRLGDRDAGWIAELTGSAKKPASA